METTRKLSTPRIGRATVKGFQFLRRWPVLPVFVIVSLAVVAIFAPFIAPHHPLQGDLDWRLAEPAWTAGGTGYYLVGGDHQGRDILSRIIFGSRISLMVAGSVLGAGVFLGTVLGIIAGYAGGAVDEAIMRLVDFFFAVPFMMVALMAVVVFGASLGLVIVLMTVFNWSPFARQTRAEVLQLKTMDYVALARVAGASPFRIAFRHILPGLTSTLMVMGSLRIGGLILSESALGYLGVGIPGPTPTWGTMVADGRDYIGSAWWISVFPGLAIFVTVFAFNFLGDWLRDWFDPRLRQV